MTLDLIATYYDLLYGHVDEDWPLWQNLAQAANGPILEVGCGTGRLLLPLAQAGYSITGLDLSPVALASARAKLQTAGLSKKVKVHLADMRQFDLPQKNFALAIIPLNTFMHCHTIEDQLSTLRSIYSHLQPQGQLAIDLFYPDPALLAEADGRLYFEGEMVDDVTERTAQWYWRHEIDLAQQMRHLTYILDEIDEAGLVRRAQIPFSLRFFYRYEMELLLRSSGFNGEAIYGSYELEPFNSHSQKMIVIARKRVDGSQ
jgi:SAM-dependent methyltransferase